MKPNNTTTGRDALQPLTVRHMAAALGKAITAFMIFVVAPCALAQIYTLNPGSTYTANAGHGQTLSLSVPVPAGTSSLIFETWGGNGDADLYFAASGTASRTNYSARSTNSTSQEKVTVNNPPAASLSFALYGYSAFSGVQFRATVNRAQSSQVATPLINPGGQSSMSPITCSITCSTAGATIRYTRDGTEPHAGSIVYTGPFTLMQSSTVKAKAFRTGMGDSQTATVSYVIINQSVNVTTLSNNQTVSNLNGVSGSEQHFRITVPAGQAKLVVSLAGGTGDGDLYLNSGTRATTTLWSQRGYLPGNNESITVANPVGGDWFIMIRGFGQFSGASLSARFESAGLVTKAQAEAVFQRTISTSLLTALNQCLSESRINTKPRIRHFLAQAHVESGGLKTFIEGATGWAYDISVDREKALRLGNTAIGDGPKYKGAGAIQVTGKHNYRSFSNKLSPADAKILDVGVNHVSVTYPFQISGSWWDDNSMNSRVDQGMTATQISKAVNLGSPYSTGTPNHLQDRLNAYNRAVQAIP